jgi:hypothetical protein
MQQQGTDQQHADEVAQEYQHLIGHAGQGSGLYGGPHAGEHQLGGDDE